MKETKSQSSKKKGRMDIEKGLSFLKESLNTAKFTPFGPKGGGCINEGQGYLTDAGPIYLKRNRIKESKALFDGEYESLAKIYATNTVRVPRPIKVIKASDDEGAFLIIEYLELKSHLKKYETVLGRNLANLHNFNTILLAEQAKREGFIGQKRDDFVIEPAQKFGFSVATSATPGFSTDNTWCDDWPQFYTRQKLAPLINGIIEKKPCKELTEYWSTLSIKIHSFFNDCSPIKPSLLHGDMWSGNVSELDTEPVLFDPTSFYGHSEFEFGIAEMFGGFSDAFYDAYHKLSPRSKGFNRRNQLYQLFHHLNHWFIFGDSYKSSSLSLMKRLCK
uniref:protein-ribulosamine 3-kinase n=1 Tax=Romanomermis culicivorax TaxID=13658 RepID=A0A915KH43_ROMCU